MIKLQIISKGGGRVFTLPKWQIVPVMPQEVLCGSNEIPGYDEEVTVSYGEDD